MIAHNERYNEATLFLDGSTFVGCNFSRCRFVYSGYLPFHFEKCGFNGCKWTFNGPAANTVAFMQSVYALGGDVAREIEKTFDEIRGMAKGQEHVTNPSVKN
jgi:hypothetical protein